MKKRLLTSGNVFKRTDGRRGGVVWYMDEAENRKRKSFSGTTKQAVSKKITAYIAEFDEELERKNELKRLLKDSIQDWLENYKFPSVEQTTYDRAECIARNQIYPTIGERLVGDVTASDVRNLLNECMNKGLAYSTVKKVYVLFPLQA